MRIGAWLLTEEDRPLLDSTSVGRGVSLARYQLRMRGAKPASLEVCLLHASLGCANLSAECRVCLMTRRPISDGDGVAIGRHSTEHPRYEQAPASCVPGRGMTERGPMRAALGKCSVLGVEEDCSCERRRGADSDGRVTLWA